MCKKSEREIWAPVLSQTFWKEKKLTAQSLGEAFCILPPKEIYSENFMLFLKNFGVKQLYLNATQNQLGPVGSQFYLVYIIIAGNDTSFHDDI